MSRWAQGADVGFLCYVRQTESKRTVQWLVDAKVLELGNPLVRHEVARCRQAIVEMPRFTDLRPGVTRWKGRSSPHTPPPLPAWARRASCRSGK